MYRGTVAEYIDATELINNVSQEQLFFKHLGIYPVIGKFFYSPFRKDKSPGCRFVWHSGLLYFVDNAKFNGKLYWSIFDVIKYVNGCSFKEALHIIATEERIQVVREDKYISRKRPEIRFDFESWQEDNIFMLSNEVLQKEHVYRVTDYWTTTKEGGFCKNCFHNPKKTLTIAYHFPDSNHVKLYFPEKKEDKWYSNCSIQDVFGKYKIDYYSRNTETLIITKSQKDRLFLDYHYGFASIATQNEGSYFDEDFIENIKAKFSRIIVLYDNDETGVAASINLCEKYGFERFFLDDAKDIFEHTKIFGKEKTKQVLKSKCNDN